MESRFKSSSGKLALFSIMTAVTVVANPIMVPVPQPLAQYDASPVLIYALGILLDPLMTGVTVAAAMCIGCVWETVGFLSLDWFLFELGMAMIDLATLVDLIFVPVAVAVVAAVRSRLGINRLT